MVDSGPVFDTLFQALSYMTTVIDENEKANRSVKLGKVLPFEGMVAAKATAWKKKPPSREGWYWSAMRTERPCYMSSIRSGMAIGRHGTGMVGG